LREQAGVARNARYSAGTARHRANPLGKRIV